MNEVLAVKSRRNYSRDGIVVCGDGLWKRLRRCVWMWSGKQSWLVWIVLVVLLKAVYIVTVMGKSLVLDINEVHLRQELQRAEELEVHVLEIGDEILDGVCVGWKSSSGVLYPCERKVRNSEEGYCVVEDVVTKRLYKAMEGREGGMTQSEFTCKEFAVDFLEFKIQVDKAIAESSQETAADPSGKGRGVVMSVHMGVLLSALGCIHSLRSSGCQLPVEIFYLRDELDEGHSLTKELLNLGNVSLRVVEDTRYFRYYSKIYAVIHSSFNDILLLDTDNIVARNPEYLFDTQEYKTKGAVFWPDHWHSGHSPLFNLDHTSLTWELFAVPFINSFEQESGQLLIDRNRASKAFPILDSYVQNADLIERLKVVWGDKELFRLGFMRAELPFHMIQTPPGLAGFYLFGGIWPWAHFCGQTLVQHDPSGDIVFFHRNTRKIGALHGWGSRPTWTHVREFTGRYVTDYRAESSLWWCGACWDLKGKDTKSIDVRDTYARIEEATLAIAVVNGKAHRIGSTRHTPFYPHNSKLKTSGNHR